MANLNGFDATQVKPDEGFEVIPIADYDALITESEMKSTNDGKGSYLKLKFQIISGKYINRVLFHNLNLMNSNEQAVNIAKAQLSAICHAVGVLQPRDSVELHHKPITIHVNVSKRKDGNGNENRITAFKKRAVQATGPAPSSPVLAGNTPQMAVSGAVGGAPWEKS